MSKLDKYLTSKNMAIALLAALALMYLPLGGVEVLGRVIVLLVAVGLLIK